MYVYTYVCMPKCTYTCLFVCAFLVFFLFVTLSLINELLFLCVSIMFKEFVYFNHTYADIHTYIAVYIYMHL